MVCGFHFGALHLDLIPFHWEIMSFGCHSWEFWLQMMAVVAVAPRKAGRQLPPWRELEVVQLENLSLRHRALQWLTSTGTKCHPLTSSSDRGRKTYLGRCSYHSQCPKLQTFSLCLLGDDRMMVSELNEHGDKVDLQVPCSTFWLRSIWMIQICSIVVKGLGPANCDFSLCLPFEVARQKLAAACVASLQHWLQSPPANVVIHQECLECSAESVRIVFSFTLAEEWLKTQDLPCFLMDYTWKTNQPGLVLGAIGPAGLRVWPDGKPHVRFCPILFLLAHSEDEDSHHLLVKKYVEMSKSLGITLTDGFFDNSCYVGAKSALEAGKTMRHVRLHRCLQHCKENMKAEGRKKCPESGVSWLSIFLLSRKYMVGYVINEVNRTR